jgi:hypothetical protein
MSDELIGLLKNGVAFLLTLMVLSYLIGDNPLYRIAVHAFVGVAAGYTTVVVLQSVLIPRFLDLYRLVNIGINQGDWIPFTVQVIPFAFGFFILLKAVPGIAPLSNFAMAHVVGVGAALAVGGAIVGTVFGQLQASWVNPLAADQVSNILLTGAQVLFGFVGAAAVLLYFSYTGKSLPNGRGERWRIMIPAAWLGQGFLAVGLAVLYAGAVAASLAILVSRVEFMYSFIVEDLLGFFSG